MKWFDALDRLGHAFSDFTGFRSYVLNRDSPFVNVYMGGKELEAFDCRKSESKSRIESLGMRLLKSVFEQNSCGRLRESK